MQDCVWDLLYNASVGLRGILEYKKNGVNGSNGDINGFVYNSRIMYHKLNTILINLLENNP